MISLRHRLVPEQAQPLSNALVLGQVVRLWFIVLAVALAGAGGEKPEKEAPQVTDPDLDHYVAEKDAEGIARRMMELVGESNELAVRCIPEAYARIEALPLSEMLDGDRYRVFTGAISALSKVKGTAQIEKLRKILAEHKDWRVRLVALHAGVQNDVANAIVFGLLGLKDGNPNLVSAAAGYLGNSKSAEAISPLIDAMKRWEQAPVLDKKGKGRKAVETEEAGRAWLACRDALHRLTGESMLAYVDYQIYWNQNKSVIDPSKIDIDAARTDEEKKKSGVLFGMEVTGINILFILDKSGSMETSDPLTEADLAELARPRTGVGEDELLKELQESRKRILRAKKELVRVVNALPEEKNFNILLFSSDVKTWNTQLVKAEEKRKKEAVAYIEGVQAEGSTFTDVAVARAFSDPRIDTIYLITDGAPTHTSYGGGDLAPDSRGLMQQIKSDVRAWNYLRRVRIFTLGFEGAEENFLKELSKQNGGRYLRIE